MHQPGKVANPARGQLNRENDRETGSAVPSRVSLFILHTQAESGAYLRDFSRVPRRRPFIYIKTVIRHRVTQLRTDGIHCRESAGTGPVNLKVVPNECCLSRSPQLICASLSHTHYWCEVGMLKITALVPNECCLGRSPWTN